MTETIKFDATLAKVTSMADGAMRIYLDLYDYDLDKAMLMQQAKIHGAFFEIEAMPVIHEADD